MRRIFEWLLLLSSCVLFSLETCPDYETQKDTGGFDYVDLHNDIRQGVAKRSFPYPQAGGGDLIVYDKKGTKSLFRLTYSSELEGIAQASIDYARCKYQKDAEAFNKPINFATYRVGSNTKKADIKKAYQWAIEDWRDTATLPLADANYNDEEIKPFANMIYYKTLQVGCSHLPCDGSTVKLAIACAYSETPKVGEPLYLENNTKVGCTKKWCKSIVTGADCDVYDSTVSDAEQSSPTAGLCCTAAEKIDGGCMTEEIRNQVITTFNEKRASLAKGGVQNGPTSAGKGKLSPATNMYEMTYDTSLETEAQTWASTCPPSPGKSELTTRPEHGETTTIIGDKTTSCADSVKQALEAWWNEITKKALNSAVKYTQVLEESVNAPTNFTQMAWAASYKVGCAVGQCDYGNLVVCRYYVRGNIYSQYIYRIGTNCASCSSTCTNGLCKAPSNYVGKPFWMKWL